MEKTTNRIQPLHDRVIVRRKPPASVSSGGIIIPDIAREKPIEGEVIAVGAGIYLEDGSVRPLDVKMGDRVLLNKYGGTEVSETLIIREDDLLGVLKGSEFFPIGGKLLIEPEEVPYKGVLILPKLKDEPPSRGRVRAVGPGMLMKTGERWPMPDVSFGDVVVFSGGGAMVVELNGKKFLSVRDENVIAVLED
jgi:chaperonin GroES